MNIFEQLFPLYPDVSWDWVFLKVTENKILVVKRKYRNLFSSFNGDYDIVKMRQEHIDLLKDGMINRIEFANQQSLF